MLVKKFWARGYRSLHDVEMVDLGPFVILYGPNGAGKSNILDALQTLFVLLPSAVDTALGADDERRSYWDAGRDAAVWVSNDDFFGGSEARDIVLGMEVENLEGPKFRGSKVDRLHVELTVRKADAERLTLRITHLYINGQKPGLPFEDPDLGNILRSILPSSFNHIGVTRKMSPSSVPLLSGSQIGGTLLDANLVSELFEAKNSDVPAQRERFAATQHLIERELGRAIDVFLTKDRQIELRSRLPEPNPRGIDIGAAQAGHGHVQMFAILAAIMLREGRLVALEEPEAHLHAPTMGRKLRSLLHDLVARDQHIDQLFVATHSNLFDLDESGYWDVALEDGKTVVRRKPLDEIDLHHLYEPGPAKHQLQKMLALYGEEVVFHTQDGRTLTNMDMLHSLQVDDDAAQAFLEAMHAAALQVTGLRAKRQRGLA